MKRIYLLLLGLSFLSAKAEWKWFNPQQAGFPVIQNQGWAPELEHSYARLPDRAKQMVRKEVWNLSRNSAGLAIHFYSNAPQIKIRYTVSGSLDMPHMPATGVSGLDLYSVNCDGNWNFCFGNYSFGDTIQYNYTPIGKDNYHDRGFEYHLYLPLYNSVTWMEIGIPEETRFDFIPQSPEKPIVLYGTSIAQGACASRPAMAWSTIVQRSLGYPLINLGFSGNGQLEKEVLQLVGETDARLYMLDCLPNLGRKEETELRDLVANSVRQLRQTRTAPILLIDHAGCSNAGTDSTMYNIYTQSNRISHQAFEMLQAEGIKNLYYLSHDELNFPADGWVDYVHPSDYGMVAQATAVEKKIREILQLPLGTTATTHPVTQRREPATYEWQTRHRDILALNKTNPPKSVILGNSIIHFWGGEPAGPHQNGPDSWNKEMHPAGYHNMGYGWDRIENVLWRVYHDELDGYNADKIVLMIGTNNLGISSDDEIIEGLRFLLSAIRKRQPQAHIKVMGILPRRAQEGWVKDINLRIQTMAEKNGYKFSDAGNLLLQKDGKIKESLFSDGLHPNTEGYRLIAQTIAE